MVVLFNICGKIDLLHYSQESIIGIAQSIFKERTLTYISCFQIQCKDKAKQCYNNASGLEDKLTCGKEFAICISNGAPTLAPPTS